MIAVQIIMKVVIIWTKIHVLKIFKMKQVKNRVDLKSHIYDENKRIRKTS